MRNMEYEEEDKGLFKPKVVNEVDVVNRLPRLALPQRRRAQHRQRTLEEEQEQKQEQEQEAEEDGGASESWH
jgi:hypothetical protein